MQKRKNIGELLIEYGKISREDLEEGLRMQKELNLRLGETLLKLGKITSADIEWVLSKQLDIPFVIVENINLDPGLIHRFSREMLLRNRILPLYETVDEIAIATDDPLNKDIFISIENYFNKKVKLSSANGDKIEELLAQFFVKGGTPALITCIEELLEKMNGTSFCRMDFILSGSVCEINVFGFGLFKNMYILNDSYRKEQVFESFESLNISLLFEHYIHNGAQFLSVYPLINAIRDISYPAVAGTFGLFLPDTTAFADMQTFRLPLIFNSGSPVDGYPFISIKEKNLRYKQTVFTIDSAPEEFTDFFVNLAVPRKCGLCRGKGCDKCSGLGYIFTDKIEGVYSSHEVNHIINEVRRWQR